jgi:hypothetical protein
VDLVDGTTITKEVVVMEALASSIQAEEAAEVASILVVEEVKEEVAVVAIVILVADRVEVAAGMTTVSLSTIMMAQGHPTSIPGATRLMLLLTKDKVEEMTPSLQAATQLHNRTKVAVAIRCTLTTNTTLHQDLELTEQRVHSLIYKPISEFV